MVLYKPAKQIDCPHYDERPDESDVSVLVIHNISLPPSQFGTSGIRELFTGTLNPDEHPFYKEIAGIRVSAHCVIYRNGEIEQFVPFNKRAWHAGLSTFQGRSRCNDFTIGIELEGTDTLPYTDAQYEQLSILSKFILQQYPRITLGRIVGHNDIAPGRKTDPGVAFDWPRYRQSLDATNISSNTII
ncbi:1,6-anhydro-N-acetylmuramyl-L-alanine amidase AmpD [Alteromonas sp. K632G]|jgi:AmpD protein|uniref:1,6-anhydro-N-acetylmuramyl-L-alanine amidase AmpD n=1 Tax=Alteromonas sp. K632G TaxID=2820757 RepID=UPI001AD712A6|nr:1,6-anhydro-N-acetylmuramyl-L-alanine amidase AmpD [Alteromonas sp. K632G]MBO7923707.1 1,6-anhydro-N-acetylmuramyl-L-alanine amidase AmpD [Alteromonas sp. K632G]|tara:strand:- start:414 stop:974 length:561 start_codon:yes stop_codon:yes gene_type:complete